MVRLSRIHRQQPIIGQGTGANVSPIPSSISAAGQVAAGVQQQQMQEYRLETEEKRREYNLWLDSASRKARVDARQAMNEIEVNLPDNLTGQAYVDEFETQFEPRMKEIQDAQDPEVWNIAESFILSDLESQRNRNRFIGKDRWLKQRGDIFEDSIDILKNDFLKANQIGDLESIATNRGKINAQIEQEIEVYGREAELPQETIDNLKDATKNDLGRAAYKADMLTKDYGMVSQFIEAGMYSDSEDINNGYRDDFDKTIERETTKASYDVMNETLYGLLTETITPDQALNVVDHLEPEHKSRLASAIAVHQERIAEQERWQQFINTIDQSPFVDPHDPKTREALDEISRNMFARQTAETQAASEETIPSVLGRHAVEQADFIKEKQYVPKEIMSRLRGVLTNPGTDMNIQTEAADYFNQLYSIPEVSNVFDADSSPAMYYYRKLNKLSRTMPTRDAVDAMTISRQLFTQEDRKERFREINTAEKIEEINGYLDHLPAEYWLPMRQAVQTMYEYGIIDDINDLEKDIDLALHNMAASPFGIVPSLASTNGNQFISQYTPENIVPAVIGNQDILMDLVKEDLKSLGMFDIKKQKIKVSSKPILSAMHPVGAIQTGAFESEFEIEAPDYQLVGTRDSINNHSFLIRKIDQDGSFFLQDKSKNFITFRFDDKMKKELNKRINEKAKQDRSDLQEKVQKARQLKRQMYEEMLRTPIMQ